MPRLLQRFYHGGLTRRGINETVGAFCSATLPGTLDAVFGSTVADDSVRVTRRRVTVTEIFLIRFMSQVFPGWTGFFGES